MRSAGFRTVPIVGAIAVTALISAGDISDNAFIFDGFAPHQGGEREAAFVRYAGEPHTIIFHESTHRIAQFLQRLDVLCPMRELVIGKELTKKFEMIVKIAAAQSPTWLAEDKHRANGEFVLV